MVGRRIAGYRLEQEAGRGGMAVVYRAQDLRLGRTVAVKLLAPELARNEVFRRRFIHESQAAAAIDHPHIVPVFEAGEADGILYLAMRFVPGRDLRALINHDAPLPADQTVRLAGQIASALDAAHEHDLVHRDVKPGNILVAAGTDSEHPEHLYLADFGLTKKSLSLSGLTTVGQIVGTLDYAAPEQISGRPVDGRCDQYGLGCVVFEMLAGTPPFRREDDLALLWAHLNEPPPTVTSRRPDLTPAVDAVLARALAKAPADRYESCLLFTAALRDATAGAHRAPGPLPTVGPPTQVVSEPAAAPPAAGARVVSSLAAPGIPEPAAVPAPPPWALPVVTPGADR
ncbi:serine/threonine-protein kinase [Kitasatospora sp. NBC_00315]|uniref:serine/threonine-protein kinase n=1 Tax=Kitasatospora sp. NBC_00315 TaxID=2975963 RepID=UPI003243B88D